MKKTIQDLQQLSKLNKLNPAAQKWLNGGGVIEGANSTGGMD